jgi:hypothetical protein
MGVRTNGAEGFSIDLCVGKDRARPCVALGFLVGRALAGQVSIKWRILGGDD